MRPTTSAARIAANQANAARSTGPRTEAGKARSRTNALTHGLTAEVVGLDAVAASSLPLPLIDGTADLNPVWLDVEITRTTGQLSHLGRIERSLRAELACRAETLWADDQIAQAEELGAKLSRNPSRTVAQLRLNPFGCRWLSTRWELLKQAATMPGGWDEAQTRLAFELLGVPVEGRTGPVGTVIAGRQFDPGPPRSPLAIAEAMITELGTQQDRTTDANDRQRESSQLDLVDLPSPELARLRRYETALRKRLYWLVAQLQIARAAAAASAPQPGPVTQPAPPRIEPNPSETKPTPAAPQVEATPSEAPKPAVNHLRPTATTPFTYLDVSCTRLQPRST